MKKILNLKGIQQLSKEDQQEIKGSWGNRLYCDGPRRCCFRFPHGGEVCDYGYCLPNGSCVWA